MNSLCMVHEHFDAAVQRFSPERLAFAAEEVAVSWGAFRETVDRITTGLRNSGVTLGSVVGYSLANSPEVVALPIALSRLGACGVPLFTMIPDAARAAIFAAFGCSLVVVSEGALEKLATTAAAMHAPYRVIALGTLISDVAISADSNAPTDLARPLLLAASSGTTGTPKSVRISQRNATSAILAAADMSRVGSWKESSDFTSMIAFPLSTSSVLVPLGMLFAGTRLVFSRELSQVRFLELAAHFKVESLSAPPAYFEGILRLAPERILSLPHVSAIHTGMDFLPPTLLNRLQARFPGIDRAVSGYGLIETSTVFMTWKAHSAAECSSGANQFSLCPEVGNAIDVRDEAGNSLPVGERGELWVCGPSVVDGYVGTSAQTSGSFEDGWFRTGDAVRRIDDGAVELCGRLKYLIKRGGKSIAPSEVQATLETCPGVLASAVVGVRNPLYGEMVWAFVVPTQENALTLTDIMRVCRTKLPNYMVPDQVTFLKDLPRGAGVGKLDREKLIQMATAELSQIPGGPDDRSA